MTICTHDKYFATLQDEISLLPNVTKCPELLISSFTRVMSQASFMLQTNPGLFEEVWYLPFHQQPLRS